MKNPCRRDCPDRAPGCCCIKREAWKFQQAQIKDAKERRNLIHAYFRDENWKKHQRLKKKR